MNFMKKDNFKCVNCWTQLQSTTSATRCSWRRAYGTHPKCKAYSLCILAGDSQVLQFLLSNLETYCFNLNITEFIKKSKMTVFRKCRRFGRDEKCIFNKNIIIQNFYTQNSMILSEFPKIL
ncbi:hypothetical protein ACFFRR_009127 [Megaselia abdita]